MSRQQRRGSSHRSGTGGQRRVLLPLIAAMGIGAMLLGLVVTLLPPGRSVSSDDVVQSNGRIQITPGAEEARMRERLRQNPEDVDAIMILAELLANTGRGSEAIQWYEQAVQRRPDDTSLRVSFGTVLERYNFRTDAELQYQKATELEPTDPEPPYLLGLLYAQSTPPREEDARRMFQRAIEAAPASVYAERAREQLRQLDEQP